MRTFKEFSHRESLSCLDERGKVYTMFLDIRDKDSFETGHIHGSINIQKDSFEKQEHLLKKGKAVIVVSENGLDAGSAGVELKRIGVEEVFLLRNGLISWYEESLPLIK